MQASTYHLAEKLKKDRVYTGKDKNVILADTAAALLTKLHQIYSGSVIDESGEGIIFDRSKVYYIKEHFKGQKIAIFYKYKAEYTMLVLNFGYDRLTSDPAKFNESDSLIFVSQITSGREGINLSSADALVMLNIDFSAVSYWQARARLQSKDREDAAKVYWLFADGGIEQKIYNMVKDKKDYTLSYFRKDFEIE
jgi:hypothetical protein